MKTRLVRIGNSRGIRIPKSFIEQAGLGEEVKISLKENALVVRPVAKAREGWADAFAEMARRGDDALIDGEIINSFDEKHWQW